jgi:hypothetical protein
MRASKQGREQAEVLPLPPPSRSKATAGDDAFGEGNCEFPADLVCSRRRWLRIPISSATVAKGSQRPRLLREIATGGLPRER